MKREEAGIKVYHLVFLLIVILFGLAALAFIDLQTIMDKDEQRFKQRICELNEDDLVPKVTICDKRGWILCLEEHQEPDPRFCEGFQKGVLK